MKLKRILVANRGEIARRVFRTIKELGMDAIAMHSEADRNSLFVKEADESFLLSNGYLDQETIINSYSLVGSNLIANVDPLNISPSINWTESPGIPINLFI